MVLQPGEKAVVHGGIYLECVRPARGGTGPEGMIAMELPNATSKDQVSATTMERPE